MPSFWEVLWKHQSRCCKCLKMSKGAIVCSRKTKAAMVDAEIDHEITYPHEISADYTNNCLKDTGIPSIFDDGSVDLQVHYTWLVIEYYINGKEHTEKISNCYMDRTVKNEKQ